MCLVRAQNGPWPKCQTTVEPISTTAPMMAIHCPMTLLPRKWRPHALSYYWDNGENATKLVEFLGRFDAGEGLACAV